MSCLSRPMIDCKPETNTDRRVIPMSFSCPHYAFVEDGACTRVNKHCVPGRPGCVLRANSVFAVPVEERLEDEDQQPDAHPLAGDLRSAKRRGLETRADRSDGDRSREDR